MYDSSAIADQYGKWGASQGLLDAERAILVRLGDALRGGSLLDIGVGAGRTAPHLSAACRRYVGIDYAEAMIQSCRRSFPHLDFRHGDARDLSAFEASSFDAAWFSFNGIDYVTPEDRLRVLREIGRILVPGGLFVFSSHNLYAPPVRPPLWPEWRRDGSPVRRLLSNARAVKRHLADHLHYRARRPREQAGDGWAVLVDTAHGYRLLTVFVTPEHQAGQLSETGFGDIETFAKDGSPLPATARPSDTWLYYVARKLA